MEQAGFRLMAKSTAICNGAGSGGKMRAKRLFCVLAPMVWVTVSARAEGRTGSSASKEDIARSLDEVARIATVMVDGDLCRNIVTARALRLMFTEDPKDQWAASDNFDV